MQGQRRAPDRGLGLLRQQGGMLAYGYTCPCRCLILHDAASEAAWIVILLFRDQLVPIHHRTKETACRHSALERLHSVAGSVHCGRDVSYQTIRRIKTPPLIARRRSSRFGELTPSENRLKNRFNCAISNGDFLQVPEFTGAPRPMKMGTIASPWRYDAARGDIPTHAMPRGGGRSHYDVECANLRARVPLRPGLVR